jgi:hypothetical protein
MVRTIITPANTDVHISIPKEYIGKPIEITYLALDELEQKPVSKKNMSDFWGVLSDATAEDMHKHVEQSRNEWEERLKKQF